MEKAYRPIQITVNEDWLHWMLNVQKMGCQEAKGLTMTIASGSTGVYNSSNDTYEFDPTIATESRGIRAGQDPAKPEYYKFWYIQYKQFIPALNGDFVSMALTNGKSNLFTAI